MWIDVKHAVQFAAISALVSPSFSRRIPIFRGAHVACFLFYRASIGDLCLIQYSPEFPRGANHRTTPHRTSTNHPLGLARAARAQRGQQVVMRRNSTGGFGVLISFIGKWGGFLHPLFFIVFLFGFSEGHWIELSFEQVGHFQVRNSYTTTYPDTNKGVIIHRGGFYPQWILLYYVSSFCRRHCLGSV